MSIKRFVLIAAAAGTVATAGLGALAPRDSDPARVQQQRQEQQVKDLSSNEKAVHDQMRRDGSALMDGANRDQLRPVEPRPIDPELKPKFKLPLP